MKDSVFSFPNKNKKRTEENPHFPRKKPKTLNKSAFIELKSFDLPLLSTTTGSPIYLLRLESDRPYIIGRANSSCDFTFDSRFVSKQHCQILYDSVDRKIFILDGTILLDDLSFFVSEFRRRFLLSDDELEDKEKEKETEILGFSRVRVSLNGVYVNGVRVKRGMVRELFAGDEVLLVCGNESECSLRVRIGFMIQGIVFKEEVVSDLDEVPGVRPLLLGAMASSRHSQGTLSSGKRNKRVFAISSNEMTIGCDLSGFKSRDVMGRAKFILSHCCSILHSDDPISCIRQCDISDSGRNRFLGLTLSNRMEFAIGREEEVGSIFPLCRQEPQSSDKKDSPVQPNSFKIMTTSEANHSLIGDLLPSDLPCGEGTVEGCGKDATANYRPGMSSLNCAEKENAPDIDGVGTSKTFMSSCSAPGKMFYLNRLAYLDCGSSNHHTLVSLHELLYPVESISKIFIATFTSDILWFLSHCEIPCHLPVTVACHNAERCWSSSPDARSSMPFPDFPNLVVVFPPFPEVIAFGNDRKKRGIACHHPKLLVLQREDSIRVVITSANLVAKQWESVTNTVWWQDFPHRSESDYLSLFSFSYGEMSQGSRSDFGAQLAGFMASLIVDVPSQAHWIVELTKYDFTSAEGHLVASIPGIHSDRILKANQFTTSSFDAKFLGLVEASVVGLSHLFRTAADTNAALLKKLALFLGKTCENAYGMLDVVLRRNTNIPADENAVSVLVPNPDELSGRDCIQLGFLPRNVAKWVSPLWDMGFFEFHGYVYREEALTATFGGNNKKVQLVLHVSQGPRFFDLSKLMQAQNIVALCSLIASVQRCTGLWRLQEVLGRYKWPESQESDFIYGASSIGSSVSAQFLAAFAASVGKKSSQIFDSEESDPEWGCWTASQEVRNPSIKILFPTIERVKNACNGISPTRKILCFSEKTWQRLRNVGILHDAVPSPCNREGHPMHVKDITVECSLTCLLNPRLKKLNEHSANTKQVARRRFWSKTGSSSFGWVYCGSHNFSAAAWGRPISGSVGIKASGLDKTKSLITSRLHICNYELGIIFLFPPTETKCIANQSSTKLDDIALPFVVPAPKYGSRDRPATAQAMREALAELSERKTKSLVEVEITENMMEEVPDEDEEVSEATNYVAEEKEEDKTYAEKLWSQVDSSQSC
ncbi:Forkhead-associated domain-containing protein / FHA domain-containing protein, putative isoform 1 [Theobroma cacao]|uniref:Forkhead-associated domain-containing protein / FHA domain-containing protein, putative isoform 1 n=1 Tax=Theobroma cacao TaxID=3641 RepID=A0A061G0J7_THECC|nr:Forkhead-associated domain-containing protein / FHA domain-containing protein, putative isoform 1 [Theobroma cacao]